MTAFRYVPKKEFDCITLGFTDHIKLLPEAAPKPMGLRPLKFSVADLERALVAFATCDAGKGILRGVIVHFGLDEHDVLDMALQLICLEPDPSAADTYTYKPTATFYTIVNDKLVRSTDPFSTWEQGNGHRYTKNVVIRHTDGPAWKLFGTGVDVTHVTFPYDGELDKLIADNGLTDESFLELVPIAEPTSWASDGNNGITEEGYYQSVCWTAVDVPLDDTDDPEAFKNKAADLGSCCPPNCIKVYLPHRGNARRPGC